jgi:hypothetical protein
MALARCKQHPPDRSRSAFPYSAFACPIGYPKRPSLAVGAIVRNQRSFGLLGLNRPITGTAAESQNLKILKSGIRRRSSARQRLRWARRRCRSRGRCCPGCRSRAIFGEAWAWPDLGRRVGESRPFPSAPVLRSRATSRRPAPCKPGQGWRLAPGSNPQT